MVDSSVPVDVTCHHGVWLCITAHNNFRLSIGSKFITIFQGQLGGKPQTNWLGWRAGRVSDHHEWLSEWIFDWVLSTSHSVVFPIPPGVVGLVAHVADGSTKSETTPARRLPTSEDRPLDVVIMDERRNGPRRLCDDDDDDDDDDDSRLCLIHMHKVIWCSTTGSVQTQLCIANEFNEWESNAVSRITWSYCCRCVTVTLFCKFLHHKILLPHDRIVIDIVKSGRVTKF